MKKFLIVVAAILGIGLVAAGINYVRLQQPYGFPNRGKAVASVELIYNKYTGDTCRLFWDTYVVGVLDEDETNGFMEALCCQETKTVEKATSFGYGEYIVRVTYANGNMEIYGSDCIESIKAGDSPTGIGTYSLRWISSWRKSDRCGKSTWDDLGCSCPYTSERK